MAEPWSGARSNRVWRGCVDTFTPMKAKLLAFAAALGVVTLVQANADDVQFVTLPQVVRTTVVRESNIPDYSRVARVLRNTFIRSLDDARYQLIEKKGNKEVYRDRNTGVKWVVKVERDDD